MLKNETLEPRESAAPRAVRSDLDLVLPVAQLRRRLGDWLPQGATGNCIDVGCGRGELLRLLENLGLRGCTGVDLSESDLDLARSAAPSSRLVCGDAIDYLADLPGASARWLFALNFIEHLPKQRTPEFFIQAFRVLEEGGRLIVIVPNAISPFGSSTRYWDFTHEQAFTPASIRQAARLGGFLKEPEFRECGPIPHGMPSAIRWFAWQALRALVQAWFLVETGSRRGPVYTMDMMVRFTR
jgi:SAM-dependent methyltransferase